MAQRWWCLGALTLARAAMGFQFQSIAAIAPLLSGSLGLDKTQLGWLIGLYLLPGVVFALPGGLLGARFGDKRLVLIGLVLMGAGGAWLALASSFVSASAARLTSGIGAVMLNVLVTKMVADWFDGKERLLAMSILINAWPIGIGIALLAIGPLSQSVGWPWGMATTALFAVIGFVTTWVIYHPPQGTFQAATSMSLDVLTRREWRLLFIGALPWLLYNAGYQIVISFLPSFFVERGISIPEAGRLIALNTVLLVVGVQAGGILLKRVKRPDLVCHMAIAGWCVSLFMLSTGATPLPWLVLGGLIGGLPAAAFVSLPAEFLRPVSRSVGMGVFYTIYYFGCAVLPALAGALYDASGTGRAAIWMATAVAFTTIPILWLFRKAMSSSPRADGGS